MAIRKKPETIHLRVSSISKACLEGLANATGGTATRVLEDLIAEASKKLAIQDVDSAVDDKFWLNAHWSLLDAMQLASVPESPIHRKLRTYFLAEEALSKKDIFLLEAILWSPQIFSGETEIFAQEEKVINKVDEFRAFKVNLDEIQRQLPCLEEYAEFRLKNKTVSPKYEEYLKMREV